MDSMITEKKDYIIEFERKSLSLFNTDNNLNDLSFVKYALEYDDEFDTMEFTSQELSFVSK